MADGVKGTVYGVWGECGTQYVGCEHVGLWYQSVMCIVGEV